MADEFPGDSMTAAEDFPRYWDVSNVQTLNTSTAQIIIPAVVGLTHVLTEIFALWYQNTASAALNSVNTNNPFTNIATPNLTLLLPGAQTVATAQWDGAVHWPENNPIQVQFANAPPGAGQQIQNLRIRGFSF